MSTRNHFNKSSLLGALRKLDEVDKSLVDPRYATIIKDKTLAWASKSRMVALLIETRFSGVKLVNRIPSNAIQRWRVLEHEQSKYDLLISRSGKVYAIPSDSEWVYPS